MPNLAVFRTDNLSAMSWVADASDLQKSEMILLDVFWKRERRHINDRDLRIRDIVKTREVDIFLDVMCVAKCPVYRSNFNFQQPGCTINGVHI